MLRITHMGPSSPQSHVLSEQGGFGRLPASVTLPLGWRRSASLVHVGFKHDEIHVIEARSCNREEDDFWRRSENTDLLGPSDCGRIIRGKRSDQYQCGGPVAAQ